MPPAAIEPAERSGSDVKLDTMRKIADAFNSLVPPQKHKTAEQLFPGFDVAVADARSRR
jgi:hypothetical protein